MNNLLFFLLYQMPQSLTVDGYSFSLHRVVVCLHENMLELSFFEGMAATPEIRIAFGKILA
jgi:hypothetical protein